MPDNPDLPLKPDENSPDPNPAPPPPIKAPIYMTVNPKDLYIDPSYQRRLKQRRINAMVAGWNWLRCEPLMISRRADGNMFVFDGGHRFHAALLLGIDSLPALVFDGLTTPEEAQAFIGIQLDRQSHHPLDKWRAFLVAQSSIHLAIEEIVHKHGYIITTNSVSPNVVRSTEALLKISRHGVDYVERVDMVLAFIRKVWGGVKGATDHRVLYGVDRFIRDYHHVVKPFDKVSDFFVSKQISLDQTIARAKGIAFNERSSAAEAFSKALQTEYDRNRRAGRLVPRPTADTAPATPSDTTPADADTDAA